MSESTMYVPSASDEVVSEVNPLTVGGVAVSVPELRTIMQSMSAKRAKFITCAVEYQYEEEWLSPASNINGTGKIDPIFCTRDNSYMRTLMMFINGMKQSEDGVVEIGYHMVKSPVDETSAPQPILSNMGGVFQPKAEPTKSKGIVFDYVLPDAKPVSDEDDAPAKRGYAAKIVTYLVYKNAENEFRYDECAYQYLHNASTDGNIKECKQYALWASFIQKTKQHALPVRIVLKPSVWLKEWIELSSADAAPVM